MPCKEKTFYKVNLRVYFCRNCGSTNYQKTSLYKVLIVTSSIVVSMMYFMNYGTDPSKKFFPLLEQNFQT